jgi:hypothetical protein
MRSHPAILLSDCEKKDPEYQHETCSKYRYARDVPEYRNVYSSVWGNSNKYSGRQSDCEAENKILVNVSEAAVEQLSWEAIG